VRIDFKDWVRRRGLDSATASSRASDVSRLEEHYGDLGRHYAQDGLVGVWVSLRYTAEDRRRGRKNPSRVFINGDIYNGLATLRSALKIYTEFLEGRDEIGSSTGARKPLRQIAEQFIDPPSGPQKNTVQADDILREASSRLGVNLANLVAATAFWVHPDTYRMVAASNPNAAWFPGTRRSRGAEKRGEVIDNVKFDDNSAANRAIKLAVFGHTRTKGFHACHVWAETCYDHRYHTSIANLVLLPASLAGLSDHDQHIASCLKFRAWELYAWAPVGASPLQKPRDYPVPEMWRAPLEPPLATLSRWRSRAARPA
jgi:hypothetical protein